MNLVPYTPGGELPIMLSPGRLTPLDRGEFAAVNIQVESAAIEQFIATIEQWFDDREEVIFVNSGISQKQGTGFIVLEWEECEPDALFLKILDTTEIVIDYSVYVRSEEAYS